uniref:hypothetical protein n=1 Tax=Phaeodactylibacter xiamenensis TaxID=1524460 RepID=UPI0024A84D55
NERNGFGIIDVDAAVAYTGPIPLVDPLVEYGFLPDGWPLTSSASQRFRLVSNGAPTWNTVNDSTYTATINFQTDLTGNSYLATGIDTSFRVFNGVQQMYKVDSIWSVTFSSASVRVVEYGNTEGEPVGQVMVFDPDGRETVPAVPFGSTGSTAQLQAAVVSWNARSVPAGASAPSFFTKSGDTLFTENKIFSEIEDETNFIRIASKSSQTFQPNNRSYIELSAPSGSGPFSGASESPRLKFSQGGSTFNDFTLQYSGSGDLYGGYEGVEFLMGNNRVMGFAPNGKTIIGNLYQEVVFPGLASRGAHNGASPDLAYLSIGNGGTLQYRHSPFLKFSTANLPSPSNSGFGAAPILVWDSDLEALVYSEDGQPYEQIDLRDNGLAYQLPQSPVTIGAAGNGLTIDTAGIIRFQDLDGSSADYQFVLSPNTSIPLLVNRYEAGDTMGIRMQAGETYFRNGTGEYSLTDLVNSAHHKQFLAMPNSGALSALTNYDEYGFAVPDELSGKQIVKVEYTLHSQVTTNATELGIRMIRPGGSTQIPTPTTTIPIDSNFASTNITATNTVQRGDIIYVTTGASVGDNVTGILVTLTFR